MKPQLSARATSYIAQPGETTASGSKRLNHRSPAGTTRSGSRKQQQHLRGQSRCFTMTSTIQKRRVVEVTRYEVFKLGKGGRWYLNTTARKVTTEIQSARASLHSMPPAQFVDQLNLNAGNVLSSSERATAIDLLAARPTPVTSRPGRRPCQRLPRTLT
jgi:hypothetical protein